MKEILEKIREKGLLVELMDRADVSRNTVIATFENESFDDLKGKQLAVYREAVKMIEEINSLPKRAEKALKS